MNPTKDVVGYTDPMSIAPGEVLRAKVSTTAGQVRFGVRRFEAAQWSAQHGSTVRLGPVNGFEEGVLPGVRYDVPLGSCAIAPVSAALRGSPLKTFGVLLMPTRKGRRRETIVGFRDAEGTSLGGLCLDEDGHAAIVDCMDRTVLRSARPLMRGRWVALAATFEWPEGGVTLAVAPLYGEAVVVEGDEKLSGLETVSSLSLAARIGAGVPENAFDGRLAEPMLAAVDACEVAAALAGGPEGWRLLTGSHGAGAIISRWDFARLPESDQVVDAGPARCDATLVNTPTRAITGPFWDGTAFDWRLRPDHYNAIHFHADDLSDCHWPDAAGIAIPEDCPSGLYALSLETERGAADVVPFVVRSQMGSRSPVALLLPTFTYLSYGNAPQEMRGPDHGVKSYPDEVSIDGHPGFGRSHYDRYADGSPVMLSSRLRPVLSMRFGSLPWGLVPDTWLLTWLTQRYGQVDVFTDEDLHREGLDALVGHRVVVTGNHPEYYSSEMLDALDAYCDGGGRMLYLGGNGFYWRVSVSERVPGQIEVRRTEDGTRAWIAEPGEGHHMMDGGYGGLWRRLGRPPNRLAGVGFAAQGFDESGYYRVNGKARSGPAAFALEGVADIFGHHGWLGNGAAGQEIDRVEVRLAPEADVHVIASSTGHPPSMLRTKEELLSFILPFEDPKARSDIAIRFANQGGAAFSVGSMAWVGALLDGGDASGRNDVIRMTANVINRFLDPVPFHPAG